MQQSQRPQPDYKKLGLPRYFIGIGIGLIVFPLLYMVATKLLYGDVRAEFGDHNVEIMKAIFGNCMILGLAFIAFTRSKVETEDTLRIRMIGFAMAFLSGILMVLFTPIFDMFGTGPIDSIESRELITFMLIMSMVFRYSVKKGAEKQ